MFARSISFRGIYATGISSGAFGPTGGFGPAGLARCLARRALRARLLGRPEAGLKPLPVRGLPPLTFSGNHKSLNDIRTIAHSEIAAYSHMVHRLTPKASPYLSLIHI